VGDRAGRPGKAGGNQRPFTAYRDALGLPAALVVHSLRHSYVSHLTEDGVDCRFIQVNVGHESDSSTAIYTISRKLHQMGEGTADLRQLAA
jgi:integrase/recombinase XerC